MIALSGQELIAWNQVTSEGWQRLIAAHPELLSLPCDVRETRNVAQLLQHIVAVELRYAERLSDFPETSYEAIPSDSADTMFATHTRATALLTQLQDRADSFWDERISFVTRSLGTLQAARRSVFVHALMHSIRHYAQLATLVRQHGIAPDWPMDYLFMDGRQA